MSRFASLVLPLDGSAESAKAAGCALWLAEALGATLHVLHATGRPLPGRDALSRLRVPGGERARVVLHQVDKAAGEAVLEAAMNHHADLVVMSARGESAAGSLGAMAQAILERAPVPVVLMPAHYREALPWKAMLAATSGEPAADGALEAAVQLAAALNLKLSVVHAEAGAGGYVDAAHHEYGRRLEQMVERALAGRAAGEERCMQHVILRPGDAASVLLEQVARQESSVLALGWHGVFAAGRAPVFKSLLERAECALLVSRRPEGSGARLKVGEEIDG